MCVCVYIWPRSALHDFLHIGIGRSPDAFDVQGFDVSITPLRLKFQPKPKPFKLIILSVGGLLCSRALPRVRQKAIMRFSGHSNLGRDKLWDLKVRPGLREFMSLLLQNFYVAVWSCMEDAILHKVLRRLFPEEVISRLQFVWGRSKCTNTNGFISRDEPYLLKEKEVLFKHHKNLFGCKEGNILFVDDQPSKHIRNKASECCYFPHTWPGPRVIDNITTACYLYIEKLIHAPNVPLYLANHITDGLPPIPRYHKWFEPFVTLNCLPNTSESRNTLSMHYSLSFH